jgi:hypothetical protein
MSHLVLGATALVLAVAFALAPVEQGSVTYEWDPGADGTSASLLLIERVPHAFELTLPCALVDGEDRDLFVSSRTPDSVPSLAVEVHGGQLVAAIPEDPDEPDGQAQRTVVEVEEDDCEAAVGYAHDRGVLSVEADGSRTELEVQEDNAFEVTGLHWLDADPEDVRAVVRTEPTSMFRNSVIQKILLLLLLVLLIVQVGSAFRSRRSTWFTWDRLRLRPSEWGMLGFAIVVAVVDLPRLDDGRVLARARQVSGLELRANVDVMLENQMVPQRWLYEWVLGTSVGWSEVILFLRSWSVIAAVAAWILIGRWILPALTGRTEPPRPVMTTAWVVLALFVAGWFATLRPEPVMVVLTLAILAVYAAWPAEPRPWPYAVVVGLVGLALATHVAGFVTALAAVPLLTRLRRDLVASPPHVLAGIAWGGAVAILAVFLGSNLRRTFGAAAQFQEGTHALGPLDIGLYVSTIDGSTAPMMLSAALAITAAVPLLAAAVMRLDVGLRWPRDAMIIGVALSPFGLLFTPSKWIWHIAVIAPVAIVGWSLVASRLGRVRTRSGGLAMLGVLLPILSLLVAWSMRPAWNARMLHRHWRHSALRHVSHDIWSSRVPWLIGEDVRWWVWLLLIATAALLVMLVVGRRRGGPGAASGLAAGLLLCASSAAIIQLTPPVLDAVVAGGEWTFVRQSAGGLVDRHVACGMPAATPGIDSPAGRSDGRDRFIGGHSMALMFAPCHRAMPQADGVWVPPALVLGPLEQRQQRVEVEYDLVSAGCLPFAGDEREQLCFAELEGDGEPLVPEDVRWFRER